MTRKIVACFSDIHAGHHGGLCNPAVKLPPRSETGEREPWTPRLWPIQEELWSHYVEDMASIVALANGDPITLVVNGDITWGKRHPDGLMSTRDSDQFLAAVSCLLPWGLHANVDGMVLVHGTESHEFGEGTAPVLVAEILRQALPTRKIVSTAHGLVTVDGVLVDAAHHRGSPGIRLWTAGNVARWYTKSLMLDEILAGNEPPRVVLGAHFHTFVWETLRIEANGRLYTTEVILLPAYCAMTHYAIKATRSAHMLGTGMVGLEVADGELAGVYPYHRSRDLRERIMFNG